jgi:hypothetical protein
VHVYMYVFMYMYVYLSICIPVAAGVRLPVSEVILLDVPRESFFEEGRRPDAVSSSVCVYTYMCVCVYVYVYILVKYASVYMHIV